MGSSTNTQQFEILVAKYNGDKLIGQKKGQIKLIESIFEKTKRTDINDYYSCQYDLIDSGFRCTIEESRNDIESNTCYELLLYEKEERTAMALPVFIYNNSIYSTDPYSFKEIDTVSMSRDTANGEPSIPEVVENGQLQLFNLDVQIWVYQYHNHIYWITGPQYVFGNIDENILECFAYTTQTDRLPEYAIVLNRDFSSLPFHFSQNEIVSQDIASMKGYRMTGVSLPNEYKVYSIRTGQVSGAEWLWSDVFRVNTEN